MRNRIKESDLDFEYTGSTYTEEALLKKGQQAISAAILQAKISNTTIYGEYPNGYKFITDIYDNGMAEGVNDAGSHDSGNWSINYEKNTLQLVWKKGWINTETRAYEVNGNIEFYDVDTGNWRTTFKQFHNWNEA